MQRQIAHNFSMRQEEKKSILKALMTPGSLLFEPEVDNTGCLNELKMSLLQKDLLEAKSLQSKIGQAS